MSFLNRLFSGKNEPKTPTNEEQKASPWLTITKLEQIDYLKELSKQNLVVIFKHSTRCGISSMVWNRFQNNEYLEREDVNFFYLDLLSYRDISTKIAHEFQVLHQSPQLIILKNQNLVYHSSHSAINPSVLEQFLD